ncbi:hypothetical protein HK105_202783 [Polyrhizophydium stewartii]|uniref:Uncharacterized protein n=1 Tax=Polyrhizophydium stewartii TaxID=2732419 RepID=A0ABR4NDD1_9FUNG|nr:hypothetical protein HK105_006570 [Polyrhizophydium stewartii]
MAVEPTRDGDSGSDAESGDTGPLPPAALRDCLRTAAVLAGSSSSTHVPPAGISFVDLLQARLEHIGDAGAPVPAGSGPLESHEPTNSSLQHNDAADPSTSALSADRSGAAAVRARFVRACLACLAKTAHVQRSLPGSQVDGVKDQSALESLVPIVVCWGMVPALDLFSSKKVLMAFKMPTNSSPNPQKLPDGASDNSGVPEAPLDRYIFADAIDQLMQLVQLDRGGFVVDILRRRYLSHLILSALAVQADAVAADLLIASSGKTLSQEICWAFTTSICETYVKACWPM